MAIGNTETIGNWKCECIFSFDKYYLTPGLSRLTEDADKNMKTVQDSPEKIRQGGITEPEALIGLYKDLKKYVDITRKRLENTPKCDQPQINVKHNNVKYIK